jgi:hypothetical protein
MWEQREDTLWLREDYWPPKRERENLGRPPSLTPAEQERAIMLIRQGMPLWKVAELFDTSYEVVRRLAKRQGVELGVQRFMVVDNSDFSANRLTARETRLILAFQGVLMLPISSSEDSYGASCVRVPARGLPSPLSGAALASLLAFFSAFPLTRRGQAHHAPPPAEAPHSRRLPRLPPLLRQLVSCGTCTRACASLARGQKPPRSTQAHTHRWLCLSQPAMPVLRHHKVYCFPSSSPVGS